MKNISKTTKTILFASLIAAMILPFSGMNFAQATKLDRYEVNDIARSLTAMEQYTTINTDGSVTLDKKTAKQNLSNLDFKIVDDYLEYQNHLVKQLRDTPDKKPVSDEYSKQKFEKLVKYIKDKKSGKTEGVTETIGNMFVPKAYAAWGDVCGQSPWNPLPEPPAILKNTGGQTAHDYLIGQGYHMVPFYAALTVDRDHGLEVDYLECDNGEMRMQAMINEPRDPATSNEYHSQGPEPNPEILAYTAPAGWWDGYTLIWHGLN